MIGALRKFNGWVFGLIGWGPIGNPNQATTITATKGYGTGPEIPSQGLDPLGDVPRYPPFDTGIPVIDVDKIILSQKDLVDRIYRTAGVSRTDFEEQYAQPIKNLAAYIHLLPATPTAYHRGAGGLFRLALEVGLHSLQGANTSVFPITGGVDRRYYLQPKWQLATFLAGLCSQVYRSITSMTVVTKDDKQWPPLLMPLSKWAESQKLNVYFIRWLEDSKSLGSQASAAFVLGKIIPETVLQYLSGDNNQVMPAMTAAVTGSDLSTSENPILRIVAPITTRVIEDDLKRSSMNYGHLTIGYHMEPHLIDAMRRLIKLGTWAINKDDGRVWIGAQGVFIDWWRAAQDITNLLTRDRFVGLPKDPDSLFDLLHDAGVLSKAGRDKRFAEIALPASGELKEGMARLAQRETIFTGGFDFEQFKDINLFPGASPGKSAKHQTDESGDPGSETPTQKKTKVDKKKASPPPVATETGEADIPPTPVEPEAPSPDDVQSSAENEPAREPEEASAPNAAAGGLQNPEEFLTKLKKENAWLLREIIGKWNARSSELPVGWLSEGFAISNEELSSHGQPVVELLEELAAKQWLYIDKTKPTRKIHLRELDGKAQRLLILKPLIADGLGVRRD